MAHNPSLRTALRDAAGAGIVVRNLNRTGEMLAFHPSNPGRRVRFNARRKDTPRQLLVLISRHRGPA